MTSSEPRSLGARVRAGVLLGTGVAAGVAAITILSRIMRSVGAVGGSCADGGPYVTAQSCPDGTGMGMLLVVGLALYSIGATIRGAHVLQAPQPAWLGWPALFLTLGWNFFEDGLIDPPEGFGGVSVGYVFCGVIFVVMGALPLVIALWMYRDDRRKRRGQQGPPPVVVHHPHLETPDAGTPRQRTPRPAPAADEPADTRDLPGGDDPRDDDQRASAMSVAGRLERLAALHASGALTDDEYRLAKAATLREEVPR